MSVSEAQKRAQKKYNEKNKKKLKIASYRNSAKTFIRSYATDTELDELTMLIMERRHVNQLLNSLDQVRMLINDTAFLKQYSVAIEIWRHPKDLLEHQKEANTDDDAVQSWFDETIKPKFNKEEPIVEIKQKGKSSFYDGNSAIDVLNQLFHKS